MNTKCPSVNKTTVTSIWHPSDRLGRTTDCKTLLPSLVQTNLPTGTMKREKEQFAFGHTSFLLIDPSLVWCSASVTMVAGAEPAFFSQNKIAFQDAADEVTFTVLKYIYFMVCNLLMVVGVILRKHIKLVFFLCLPPPKCLSFTYGNPPC